VVLSQLSFSYKHGNLYFVTKGFLKFLTDYEKLKLLCFVTDLGYLYSRFQKQLQADYVTIYDLEEKKNAALKS